MVAQRDSVVFDALQAVVPVLAAPVDRLGSPVRGAVLTFASASESVASVDTSGNIRARANGTTFVTAAYGNDTASILVRVAQRPTRVVMSSDTLRFVALGETQVVQAVALDSLGYPVSSEVQGLSIADTTLAQQLDSATVRSRANGSTQARFNVAGLPVQVVIAVNQVPTSINASVTIGKPIVTLPVGSSVPVACQAFDRNGYFVSGDPTLMGTVAGTVVGTTCSSLRVQQSGSDTLTFGLGSAVVRIPAVIAAAPSASGAVGSTIISVDSLPGAAGPWAPSARLNEQGQLEVYYTAWSAVRDSSGYTRGDLHRLIWLGENRFRHDTLIVQHDDDICSPQGSGIENMVIVPRLEAPGWRMLYAAGSNKCYGWQVFSAVSGDGRIWTKEPGVRLSNGGTAVLGQPPWPAGEGMSVDQLPDGEWRMIVGTFEHITPPATATWQITEWRSSDQLQWTYIGPVLTTRDMPVGWQGSVYSPTIRQVGPGLWRMLFTADGRGTVGSRSGIWSAVSTDREHWQVETQVLGAGFSNLYYCAVVGDEVIFIRRDDGGPYTLAIATVTMR